MCGIEADEIRRMARELAAAERAAVYGRIGTCTQEFGTLASWLVDVLNVLTGNLDRAGRRDVHEGRRGRGEHQGRAGPRPRRAASGAGRAASAASARCSASCPCRASSRRSRRRARARSARCSRSPATRRCRRRTRAAARRALDSLDLMVSVDIYLNETTQHADVILPAPSPLQQSHYDIAFYQFSVRNVANYSPALFALDDGMEPEWRTLLRLTGVAAGQGPDVDVDALDDFVVGSLIAARAARRALARCSARTRRGRAGRARAADGPGPDARPAAAVGSLRRRLAPRRYLEAGARTAIDLGALEPRLPEALRTASGTIELAPSRSSPTSPRLEAALRPPPQRRLRARRAAAAALEQLVDAQPHLAREGQAALHRPRASRRRGAARAGRRRAGGGERRASARSRSRSRSPTRSCPASSASRTAGATTTRTCACASPPSTRASNSQRAGRRVARRRAVG